MREEASHISTNPVSSVAWGGEKRGANPVALGLTPALYATPLERAEERRRRVVHREPEGLLPSDTVASVEVGDMVQLVAGGNKGPGPGAAGVA